MNDAGPLSDLGGTGPELPIDFGFGLSRSKNFA